MADMQHQQQQYQEFQQQTVREVKINVASSSVGSSGTRPLQMSNVGTGSPGVVEIRSTPIMLQGGGSSPAISPLQSPPVAGQSGVVIMGGQQSPTSPVAGVTIRSSASTAYNGPSSLPQQQPIAITPSPAAPAPVPSPTINIAAGGSNLQGAKPVMGATSAPLSSNPVIISSSAVQPVRQSVQLVSNPQPSPSPAVEPSAAAPPATAGPKGPPRMTPKDLLSKADPMWVCGFALVVMAIAFASMAGEGSISIIWLLVVISAASIGTFVKLQL